MAASVIISLSHSGSNTMSMSTDFTPSTSKTASLTSMKISTFQIKYKDFLFDLKMKEDKVVQSAINSGYPLINHIQYYEVLYNERI